VVTFSDSVTFHVNGDVIHAFHVEHAHTDGDTMVHFEQANVLHMGDVFFNGTFPFIDVYSGGSLSGTILVAYRDMLQQAHAAIAPMVRRGMSLEQIKAAEPLAPLVDAWGGGFINAEQFLGLVYKGMAE